MASPLGSLSLNQVLVQVDDFEAALAFYQTLGLRLIVSARGDYARFETPDGGSTLSIALTDKVCANGTEICFEVEDVDAACAQLKANGLTLESDPEDKRWLWREASLRDPSGNLILIYHAGKNRRFPPWRLEGT